MTESNRIEYKRELSEGLEREIIAFLNYHDGGMVYIGVDNNGQTIGIDNADALQLAIKDRIKNNIQPSALGLFDVILEARDGGRIIKIILASGPEKPYYLRKYGMSAKGCFIRIGSDSEPMPVHMIEELFARRTRSSLSRIRSPRQDLSFAQLKIYYEEAGFALNDKFAANLELLTEDGAWNYAAYLLADGNGNSVQVAKYAGADRVNLLESKEYGYCCLVKTCKAVLDRLEGQENRNVNRITARERIERPFWDKVALREAVINAIIHNDYCTELVPKFEVFTDRLEITSAGTIHQGREQEDFFAGYSMPRNKTLMRVFKDLGMVEYLGSGIPRILKAYPRESFTFSAHFVRACFPISQEALDLAQAVAGADQGTHSGAESGAESKQVGEQVGEQVSEQVAEVLIACKAQPRTRAELLEVLGLANVYMNYKRHLFPLLEKGFIEMTISDKPNSRLQKYRLTGKGSQWLARHGHGDE